MNAAESPRTLSLSNNDCRLVLYTLFVVSPVSSYLAENLFSSLEEDTSISKHTSRILQTFHVFASGTTTTSSLYRTSTAISICTTNLTHVRSFSRLSSQLHADVKNQNGKPKSFSNPFQSKNSESRSFVVPRSEEFEQSPEEDAAVVFSSPDF